jgi:superfamily II DNA or RNA helicase
MTFAVGSLVRARGREWVVLPQSEPDLLMLRPLGGSKEEVTGIYVPLEPVEHARFALPDPAHLGDFRSCRLLRDALRLGFRSSAGPFRSFAHLAIEPRPYQLVPLLVALKLDPVRILIADDVGIGKTVEAALIARELLDRGEVTRLAVLCPPQLAEQWQRELRDKFNIDAQLVLPGTATRLERGLPLGESLFEHHPFVIVSLDFIKSDRRRDEFLRTCPELVIVDEAHTCAWSGEGRSARHQRHQLVSGLTTDPNRHIILVTATPHSGKEDAFRSLLTLLNPDFASLPADLTGPTNETHRRRLAAQFVQRRRADIRHFLQANTPFPDREEKELTYRLTDAYRKLFDRVLEYAREVVTESTGHRQRVQWWSVLALLRALASSPAAAAATLRTRAATLDTETTEEANAIGRRAVLDLTDDESAEGIDLASGSDAEAEGDDKARHRRRLQEMARTADGLKGELDAKLAGAIGIVSSLLKDGYQPIVFCRFIQTAEYVATALRSSNKIPRGAEVVCVTGELAPAEREDRISALAEFPQRILVATDCLSEGINLQRDFNAILHYDLSWNPTRHEQREGRVDRYGQPSPKVRVVTYYGEDTGVDRIILRVLLRKHKTIRSSLGISVPVPARAEELVEAIFEDVLLHKRPKDNRQMLLEFGSNEAEAADSSTRKVQEEWQNAAEREARSRTMFAQETIKFGEVAQEVDAVRTAIGSGVDVAAFCRTALRHYKASISDVGSGIRARIEVSLQDVPRAVRDSLPIPGNPTNLTARFELPVQPGEFYLHRTHPLVEALATGILDSSLDSPADTGAARCGVVRTKAVDRRTTLLLVRLRYHIETEIKAGPRGKEVAERRQLLAEDSQVLAFAGSPQSAEWLSKEQAEALLEVIPDANIAPELQRDALQRIIDGVPALMPHLESAARSRAAELLEAHRRVRSAARLRGVSQKVEPQLPPDILGIYVFLPVPAAGGQA